ncbi:MAG TPA: hypothetical protein VGB98_04090 [Pyrinomonadaceae bacterium]|jgi:hypothetical protein
MTDQEIRTLDMFKRVRNFDATHDGLFPAGTLARDLFDVIVGSVNDLEGFAAAQSSGRAAARLSTTGKAAARAALLEDLRIIRRTARSMAVVTPGLDDKFRIPRNPTDRELLDTARAFLADAEPLKAEFLRREVQERVFQELVANVAAFESALGGQYTGQGESTAAVASIDAAIDRATDALRQLDPIVRNKLHNDHATLAAWESAKRTERAARRSNPGTPPAPPDPKQ